ncbi:unnamed protein product [Miscanthus lutarioriparius]|uniref:HNH domain-containing protein n=1 Tax=Miscanthus lutarioriparius TaxID=422564 RepID=A0A811NIH8_9POAL|nr:unnamed protein product [Miscanthus lutarioriparius]
MASRPPACSLDEHHEAVVGDFGRKLLDRGDFVTSLHGGRGGTMGHIGAEYLSMGRSSEKTDVFGRDLFFGARGQAGVALELRQGLDALPATTRRRHLWIDVRDNRPFDIYHQINMLWPHMLGRDKFDYAKNIACCMLHEVIRGKYLRTSLRIRWLKEHLLNELPPKRRQIIRLKLKAPDIRAATSSCVKRVNSSCNGTLTVELPSKSNDDENTKEEEDDDCKKSPRNLTPQEIGIAKLSGFSEWFSNHFIMDGFGANHNLDPQSSCQKTIIFAHHLKVLDGIQVKVAIIGITAGGVGLDFSSAQNVIFVELPKSASELLQNTSDESHWLQLNQSLFHVSSLMNGKKDAVREIEVDQVCQLEEIKTTEEETQCKLHPSENHNAGSCRLTHGPKYLLESDDLSINGFLGIEDLELDSDFTIRTIPLEFEDERPGTSLKNNPTPTVLEDRSCIDVSLSPAAAFCSVISSCKSVKARKRLSGNSGSLSQAAPVPDFPFQVESLRFEVNRHTGRIHLYSCVPGHDSRPKPLCENFLPEELNSPLCSPSDVKTRTLLLKKIPAFCNVFKAFIKEWMALRPIDQNKLLGKPLQLPLSLELCFLKDSINHSTEGILKGGSKRRAAPLNGVSNPLPENAEWRQVVLRNGTCKERQYTQGWTIDGEPLCKLCQGLCNGRLAKSPEYFEDLFCGLACFQEYRLRTSGRALRQLLGNYLQALFQIERGKCSQCKLDCCKLVKHIKPLPLEKREEYIRKVAPNIVSRKKLLDKLVHEPIDGNAWHADHIIPVYKGGGECKLENMGTLCVACHYEVIRAQHKELKEIRKKAKEHLKNALNKQKDKPSEATEELDDEFLLVAVPGSAYSLGFPGNVADEKAAE